MIARAAYRSFVGLVGLVGLVVLAGVGLGCARSDRSEIEPTFYRVRAGGNAEHGAQLIQAYGCGACHHIPGIRAARGVVGPELDAFATRAFIAGHLPNTPENAARWVNDPRGIAPGTAMPRLGLRPEETRDVVAYLFTLN